MQWMSWVLGTENSTNLVGRQFHLAQRTRPILQRTQNAVSTDQQASCALIQHMRPFTLPYTALYMCK